MNKILLAAGLLALAVSAQEEPGTPTIIWHGMGDFGTSPGMQWITELIEDNTPDGTYVHSLETGEGVLGDILSGFLKPVNDQVQEVCDLLASDERYANGYHAVGLSQGGQFLRAVAQRCPSPPMRNLISLGGQHQGVFGFPGCPGEMFELCNTLREILSQGAYIPVIQEHLVQAQYWHDPVDEETYAEESVFLADINNEKAEINQEYADNLASLENFVMVTFTEDVTVEPRESEHFDFYVPGSETEILPLRESAIYLEDRIGLKRLDEAGKLVFMDVAGGHLQFEEEWFVEEIVIPYLQ